MRVPKSWTQTHEFACHAAACAPPPAGSGGSLGGSKSSFLSAEGAAAARKTLGIRIADDSRPARIRPLSRRAKLANTNFLRAQFKLPPLKYE